MPPAGRRKGREASQRADWVSACLCPKSTWSQTPLRASVTMVARVNVCQAASAELPAVAQREAAPCCSSAVRSCAKPLRPRII
jgi:hypothetical protein